MKIGPCGLPELMIVLVALLLIFGARRLPEIGSSFGRGIRTFKSSVTEEDEKKEAVKQNLNQLPEGGQRY